MKRCPTCDKTFEDSMRFCQSDGTPLVDDAPPLDPYATIVGMPPIEIASADEAPAEQTPAEDTPVEAAPAAGEPALEEPFAVEEPSFDAPVVDAEADPHPTVGSLPISEPDDVLDLPEADPLKTMYVSDAEMASVLRPKEPAEEPLIDLPPVDASPEPEPPSFDVPDVPAPSFGDMSPPPSPFSTAEALPEDQPMTAPPSFEEAEPVREEAETLIQPQPIPVFDPPPPAPAAEWAPPPAPVQEWTPPPAPQPAWQNQEIGSNTPFQPPPAGVEGESKGLAIGALVCGVLSCLCCFSVITGPAAVIMGFIAKKHADENPSQFGGRGMAMAGIITGAVGFIVGTVLIVLQIFFGILSNLR